MLVGGIARDQARVSPGAHLIDREYLDIQALDQLQGFRMIQRAALDVRLVERIEILIQPAQRHGMSIGFDLQAQMDEPHRLQRLPESFRRVLRHFPAVARDLQKLFPTFRILFSGCFFIRQICETVRKIDDRLQRDRDRLQKRLLTDIFNACQIQALQAALRVVHIIAVSYTHLDVYKRQHAARSNCGFQSSLRSQFFPPNR